MSEIQPKTTGRIVLRFSTASALRTRRCNTSRFSPSRNRWRCATTIAGGHTKNLFVKDKKDNYFLLTVEENATVDLKTVHTLIGGASSVSFGRPEKLMEYLGVIPGAVTAFGVINDIHQNVKIIIDEDLMTGRDRQLPSLVQRCDDVDRFEGSAALYRGDWTRSSCLESNVLTYDL